jgi:hypothetical protein
MTYHDPRADLERLPSETLYAVARNESAQHRLLAIRILIERGSRFALQPDIVEEARELRLRDPAVLLPGVIDIFAEKIDIDSQVAALRTEHATYRAATEQRLALLERSPWRQLVDWLHNNVYAGHGY